MVEESDFTEEPRRLDEILKAEQEFFDLISLIDTSFAVFESAWRRLVAS